MLVLFVQFETSLTEDEFLAVAREREPEYRKIPTLIQKYYLKLDKPNHYGGLMIWESAEALAKFRETDLAKTAATAYHVIGAPEAGIHEVLFPLRDEPRRVQEHRVA